MSSLSSTCSCRYFSSTNGINPPNSYYGLDDGVEPSSIDTAQNGPICTVLNSPVAAITISYGVILGGGPVTARTFMSVWTKNSVAATNFQTATQTVSFKLGSSTLST